MNKRTFLTLKEASEKSGYSADYIGQLIRSGKLPGKQMYSGVAWVTTEEALSKYLNDSNSDNKKSRFKSFVKKTKLGGEHSYTDMFLRAVFYVAIFFGLILVLTLLFVLVLKIERILEQRGIQEIQSVHS